MLNIFLSLLFVVLYGSGFVATQIGIPYVDPLTFLSLRFFIAFIILLLACVIFKPSWPINKLDFLHQSISGSLIVGVFSIGVFISIDLGTPAATSALIISLQPLVVSLLSFFIFGDAIKRSQGLGLLIGILGVSCIVYSKLGFTSITGILMSFLGLFGLACGSLYQKKFCVNMNIISGGVIHNFMSCILCVVLALFYGNASVEWNYSFVASLFWMSIVVSIGALSVYYILIRHVEISRVSSLFYLVPVSSLLFSFVFFGSAISLTEIVGVIVTSVAVFLINGNLFGVIKNKSS